MQSPGRMTRCAGRYSSIRRLRGKTYSGLAQDHLARRVTEKLACGRLELIAPPDEGPSQFVIRHWPLRLIDAIWQQFAGKIAGMMIAARCPAPGCGRWFPRSVGRSDRQFCSHACQMRAWRKQSDRRSFSNQGIRGMY